MWLIASGEVQHSSSGEDCSTWQTQSEINQVDSIVIQADECYQEETFVYVLRTVDEMENSVMDELERRESIALGQVHLSRSLSMFSNT